MKKLSPIRQLTVSALCLALCLVLPFLTGQIPEIGNMLLPMHLPVLLCGLICGWQWGGAMGAAAPFLRSLLFGRPAIFPSAVGMAFELCAYGVIIGLVYAALRKKGLGALYISLIAAMLGGRLVWAAARLVLAGVGGDPFSWSVFVASGFTSAIPGIILQLVLIPAIMVALDKTGLVTFQKESVKA